METTQQEMTDKSLHISCVLNAPVALAWQVWTEADHIKHWWGPEGFTNTIKKMDLCEGGEWLFTMHSPDGQNFPNKSIFRELVPHKKFVYQHYHPDFLGTALFEDMGDKTKLTWSMEFETTELFDTVVNTFKADEGMRQNIVRLEVYLAEL